MTDTTLTSKTNYGRKVPDFCGRLYTDDQPNGAAGTWVRRAEVDALLDEIAMLRRRLETRELNDLVQKHCSDETLPVAAPSGGHTVFCDHCDASALLPYTDATKSSVAIGPMQGWNIETRMGVMCPKCASKKAGERERLMEYAKAHDDPNLYNEVNAQSE